MTPLLLVGLILGAGNVSETRTWASSHTFPSGQPLIVAIENIWGDVTVVAHDADRVEIEVDEIRTAANAEWLARSRDILDFRVIPDETGVMVTLQRDDVGWNHRTCRGCRLDASIHVRVPAGASVIAGTVNDGAVVVSGVTGTITASNVNGPVTVSGARSCERIVSVNGRVKISFSTPPQHQRCLVESINGDLRVELPDAANADITLLGGRGRVHSDFELTARPSQPVLAQVASGRLNRYQLTQGAEFRLGSGGPVFAFDSMNGDVEIARQIISRRNLQ